RAHQRGLRPLHEQSSVCSCRQSAVGSCRRADCECSSKQPATAGCSSASAAVIRIGRTIPPAAPPLGWSDLWHAVTGALRPAQSIRALERELRAEFGAPHVFTVSSGKAALTLTLMALKAGSSKCDVIIPAYTCFSVPAAVLKAGLRPVLCDIDP